GRCRSLRQLEKVTLAFDTSCACCSWILPLSRTFEASETSEGYNRNCELSDKGKCRFECEWLCRCSKKSRSRIQRDREAGDVVCGRRLEGEAERCARPTGESRRCC